ncbi:hypothetical protein [Neptunicella sp.]|uniref:hypothetical protein n=1 Tax=Neptunicella sp. TaxID=2125986 RepID=UPI003F68F1C8
MATLSTAFGWWEAVPNSYDPTQINNAKEYKAFTAKRGSKHVWEWDLTLKNSNYDELMDFYSFLVGQGGQGGIWNLPSPLPQRGTLLGTPLVRASTAKGQFSIPLKGFPNSSNSLWKVGNFIQFAGHTKCYMVQNVINSNSSGESTVQIYPGLFASVAADEVIKTGSNVLFQVRLESDMQDLLIAANTGKTGHTKCEVREIGA